VFVHVVYDAVVEGRRKSLLSARDVKTADVSERLTEKDDVQPPG
jgi:hypothetical protein